VEDCLLNVIYNTIIGLKMNYANVKLMLLTVQIIISLGDTVNSKKMLALKTIQFAFFGNTALGRYWTDHSQGCFDPASWIE
jgi:hypothetical protein